MNRLDLLDLDRINLTALYVHGEIKTYAEYKERLANVGKLEVVANADSGRDLRDSGDGSGCVSSAEDRSGVGRSFGDLKVRG